jgi:hypothetical protein
MMGKMPRITGNFTEQTLNAKTARTDVFQAWNKVTVNQGYYSQESYPLKIE